MHRRAWSTTLAVAAALLARDLVAMDQKHLHTDLRLEVQHASQRIRASARSRSSARVAEGCWFIDTTRGHAAIQLRGERSLC